MWGVKGVGEGEGSVRCVRQLYRHPVLSSMQFWCPYYMYWKPLHVGSVTSDATTFLSVNCCVCSVKSLPSSPSCFKGALAVVCISSTSCCCLHMCANTLEMLTKATWLSAAS